MGVRAVECISWYENSQFVFISYGLFYDVISSLHYIALHGTAGMLMKTELEIKWKDI